MRAHLRRDPCGHEDGFTLVELLVAISIVTVLGSVVTTSIVRSLQVSTTTTQRVEVLTALQRAQERISRTVRAADPVVSADGTTLVVQEWSNGDVREVTYALVDETIQRTVQDPTGAVTQSTVIEDLAQGALPVFTYRDAQGDPWPGGAPGDIHRVEITLIAAFGDQDDGEDDIVLSTSVFPRNAVLEETA